jgi:hypothetical protein
LDGMTVGVYSKRAVSIGQSGCPVNERYLRSRGIWAIPKVLVIGGKDRWLRGFSRGVGDEFFSGLTSANISAIVCPNYSAYRHVEHWVWLDNRAIGQRFMGLLLERGLPGIFHTYLEDSRVHIDWLVEYLRQNPSQHFIATGFDRGGANGPKFVSRRLDILTEVERRVGRPLHVVLSNLLTRLCWVNDLAAKFPGRVHLVGQSVFLRSVQGSELYLSANGHLNWRERAEGYERGVKLFQHNADILERAIREKCPDFFFSGAVGPPHFAVGEKRSTTVPSDGSSR